MTLGVGESGRASSSFLSAAQLRLADAVLVDGRTAAALFERDAIEHATVIIYPKGRVGDFSVRFWCFLGSCLFARVTRGSSSR